MTTAIDFGALLLIGAGWFVLAVGVALFFCALFQGAKYRDYSIPPQASDVSYERNPIEAERLRREAATQRAMERFNGGKAA